MSDIEAADTRLDEHAAWLVACMDNEWPVLIACQALYVEKAEFFLDGALQGYGGRVVTIDDLVRDTGYDERVVVPFLKNNPMVNELSAGKYGEKQYRSLYPPLIPTAEGLLALAQLGTIEDLAWQARRNWHEEIEAKNIALSMRRRQRRRQTGYIIASYYG